MANARHIIIGTGQGPSLSQSSLGTQLLGLSDLVDVGDLIEPFDLIELAMRFGYGSCFDRSISSIVLILPILSISSSSRSHRPFRSHQAPRLP